MAKTRAVTWVPRTEDYLQVLREQNPWKLDGSVPDTLACSIERPLADSLWKRLRYGRPRRYQVILGPRRVGKTTCLYQTVRRLLNDGVSKNQIWWLRLDHPLLMRVPLDKSIKSILKISKASLMDPVFLFLDEISYAVEWDLWLKTFFDEQWPIQVASSSSSTVALKDRRMESGVGRWEEQYLAPYLFGEYLSLLQKMPEIPTRETLAQTIEACIEEPPDLGQLASARQRYLLTGGFPELLVELSQDKPDIQDTLLRSQQTLRDDAIVRAIYKDIPQVFGVDSPMMLERMLYTLAGQMTGILSPTDICGNLGFSQPTFDRYLSYLIQAFLVFTLPNYAGSEPAKQKRGRKLYFVDGAVRNAALQRGIAPLSDPAEMGLLLENLIAGHLHALSQQTQVRLYHWRHKRDEVDLIYDHPGRPLAIEVAASTKHNRRGLHRLIDRFPRFKGRSFLVAPNAVAVLPRDTSDEVGTLSLDLLLLATSAQAERELRLRLTSGTSGVQD